MLLPLLKGAGGLEKRKGGIFSNPRLFPLCAAASLREIAFSVQGQGGKGKLFSVYFYVACFNICDCGDDLT